MLDVGEPVSGLDGLEFRWGEEQTSLGELHKGGPLVLVFLRHFG